MSDLEINFKNYSEKIKNIEKTPSDDDLLILYGLYKQATIGNCNIDRPGFLNFKGKAKWDSWNKYKDKDKKDAMVLYIEKVKQLIA